MARVAGRSRRALRSAWQQAAAWRLERIATPLIGVGPGRLTIEDAAELLGESFPSHDGAGTAPHLLRIIVDSEEERETVDAALRKYRS
jgi:hypothetical protein